jgi:hypothetical protein
MCCDIPNFSLTGARVLTTQKNKNEKKACAYSANAGMRNAKHKVGWMEYRIRPGLL